MDQIISRSKRSASSTLDPRLSRKPRNDVAAPASRAQLNAPLENLPPEIRLQVLSLLDLDELKAVVHASPVYHEQYLLYRRPLLEQCLQTTLGSVYIDAYAAYQAGTADFFNARTREAVENFLESYHDQRSSARPSIYDERLNGDEALGIAVFHSAIVQPLIRCYSSKALSKLASEGGKPRDEASLSRTEETRLMRAMYRFQLCCNLFGIGAHEYTPEQPKKLNFGCVDIMNVFFSKLEPWEVEEIGCIYAFAQEKYNQIFNNIHWDVHQENPKFEGQSTPTGTFDLDNSLTRDSLMQGTISRGLELLHTVFFNISDHAHLVSTMQQQITRPVGNFLGNEEALSETAQRMRRQQQLSEQDQKQDRRDPMPFTGDSEANPPLAWTIMWLETYSNLYGFYVKDCIRRWGYIMWDQERIERTGAKDVLSRQWVMRWGDPRDAVY